jgi:hypothetical protein
MIDAVPSLNAASHVDGRTLVAYLAHAGWEITNSKFNDVLVAHKLLPNNFNISFVVPLDDDQDDALTRKADALRALASIEKRTLDEIVDSIFHFQRLSLEQSALESGGAIWQGVIHTDARTLMLISAWGSISCILSLATTVAFLLIDFLDVRISFPPAVSDSLYALLVLSAAFFVVATEMAKKALEALKRQKPPILRPR